jgi:hypothetical protein
MSQRKQHSRNGKICFLYLPLLFLVDDVKQNCTVLVFIQMSGFIMTSELLTVGCL